MTGDAEVRALESLGRVHLVGIGGAGVSVVARLLAARGVPVQGSDAADGPALAALRADGLTVWVGHDAAHVVDADGTALVDTLVVSSAVRDTNPELAAARAAGIAVLHRSEALARLMEGTRAVAVAGAHGKTTTSAMVATALGAAGVDASYAIGGTIRVRDAAGERALPGGHAGAADVLVAEADESDGSFLNYAPTVAVVTNVEADHLDHYGTHEAFEQAFADFAARIVPGGWLVACADDPGSARLARRHRAAGGSVVTYGTAADADVVVRDVEVGPGAVRAVVAGGPLDGEHVLDLDLPGRHNALNATAAVVTAVLLGVDPAAAVAGAHEFVGTGRRFEPKGEVAGIRVFDSYDHHPTEVDALLRAARPVAGDGRLLVLFQPHLYSRTRTFAQRFADALALADEVVVTGVYRAREDVDATVDATTITGRRDRTDTGGLLRPVEDRLEAAHALAALAVPGDVLLTVGAGDVTELGPVVLADLAARFGVADPGPAAPGATMG